MTTELTGDAWAQWWATAAPRVNVEEITASGLRVITAERIRCDIRHRTIASAEVLEIESRYRATGAMRWIFDARDKDISLETSPKGFVGFRRDYQWSTIGTCTSRVMLDLGAEGVLSCERIDANGKSGWGYVYPQQTIRAWIGGRDFREGWPAVGRADVLEGLPL